MFLNSLHLNNDLCWQISDSICYSLNKESC
uniref:Uncharacterized protein n=1 Tax=Anguilla anguilla TaxID=7936 RepID=A0A0E9V950_ANGAN